MSGHIGTTLTRPSTIGMCICVAAGALLSSCTLAPPPQTAPAPATLSSEVAQKSPSRSGSKVSKNTPSDSGTSSNAPAHVKPYSAVITSAAKTRNGMFKTHRVGDKLYFEIPSREMDKDMLLVGRYTRAALGNSYGGDQFSERTIRLERSGNRVIMRSPSFATMADTSLPIYRAVAAGNYPVIDAIFDVMTYGQDSAAVIDVTRLFVGSASGFKAFKSVDRERSWIENVTAFPDNVEVEGVQTSDEQSAVAHWSIIRLPEHPMMPRLADDRVGFLSLTRTDFGSNHDYSVNKEYINRWRLVKKDPHAALSEPVEPIVYYIDPATPEVWKPWIRKAVLAWQPAFERAGFKNAIIPMDPPANDPDWSPEDIRHTVIRWLPSTTENAEGPHISDPRTGEILNGSIRVFNDVLKLARDWYFTQVAPLDPRAQRWTLPDSLMGSLIQYVVTHEIGHTLGFPHNHKASSTYPADSVHSATWVHKMGAFPSIMDYARFNYVAQPEDHIAPADLLPRVGPYDMFATMWGYTPIPTAQSPEQERPTLDMWARMQDSIPWYRFGNAAETGLAGDSDPGDETEAIGDADAVKSTDYGLKNLERIAPMLLSATQHDGEDNSDMNEAYKSLVRQWTIEMKHVARIVGGADTWTKYGGQPGPVYTPLPRARQVAAVKFLNEHAFRTPTFLLDTKVLRRLEPNGSIVRVANAQAGILTTLLNDDRTARMVEYQALAKERTNVYTVADMLGDLRRGIWSELSDRSVSISVFRRSLQQSYLTCLDQKMSPKPATSSQLGQALRPAVPILPDVRAALRGNLTDIRASVISAIPRSANRETQDHLRDVLRQIDNILDPKK